MTATNTEPGSWYWCLNHQRAEGSDTHCPPDDRLGPYESEDAARHWKDRVEARNDTWEAEDKAWEGDA
ncbi:MAG TPA: hypothetical protein VF244_01125 [Acidimicrobiales bacterium]